MIEETRRLIARYSRKGILIDTVKLDAAFGNYSTAYEVKEGLLHFTRRMVLNGATVPADDYAKVRGFFEKVRAAEQSPVVLAKK